MCCTASACYHYQVNLFIYKWVWDVKKKSTKFHYKKSRHHADRKMTFWRDKICDLWTSCSYHEDRCPKYNNIKNAWLQIKVTKMAITRYRFSFQVQFSEKKAACDAAGKCLYSMKKPSFSDFRTLTIDDKACTLPR